MRSYLALEQVLTSIHTGGGFGAFSARCLVPIYRAGPCHPPPCPSLMHLCQGSYSHLLLLSELHLQPHLTVVIRAILRQSWIVSGPGKTSATWRVTVIRLQLDPWLSDPRASLEDLVDHRMLDPLFCSPYGIKHFGSLGKNKVLSSELNQAGSK